MLLDRQTVVAFSLQWTIKVVKGNSTTWKTFNNSFEQKSQFMRCCSGNTGFGCKYCPPENYFFFVFCIIARWALLPALPVSNLPTTLDAIHAVIWYDVGFIVKSMTANCPVLETAKQAPTITFPLPCFTFGISTSPEKLLCLLCPPKMATVRVPKQVVLWLASWERIIPKASRHL